MTVRRKPLLLVALISAAAIVSFLSIARVRPGELLVTASSIDAGPSFRLVPPFRPHRLLPGASSVKWGVEADLGSGARWPMRLEAQLTIDPSATDETSRRALLEHDLEALLQEATSRRLGDLIHSLGPERIMAAPRNLTAPLQEALQAVLPHGLSVTGLTVAVAIDPQQARAAALSALARVRVAPLARVLYIGLDGADWEVIDPLLARGELPNISSLIGRGVRAELQSYEPMVSPLLWTTALTGLPPDMHGICDFVLEKPDGKKVPITSSWRKRPALWEILAAAGQASAFSGFWGTHPAEHVPGSLVSDLVAGALADGTAPRDLAPAATYPPHLLDPLAPRLLNVLTVPAEQFRPLSPRCDAAALEQARQFAGNKQARAAWEAANPEGRRREPDAFLLSVVAQIHNQTEIGLEMLRDRRNEVVGLYFEAIDLVGHYFQHDAPPDHPLASKQDRERFGGTIEAVYRLQDAELGRLLDAIDSSTVVIVHSDHGFAWGSRRPLDFLPFTKGQPVEWHRHRGIFIAAGAPVRHGTSETPVTLFDIAPTILALRGVPQSSEMPGVARRDLLVAAAAAQLPSERVSSWDPLVAPRDYGDLDDASMGAAQQQLLESLQGLGYVSDTAAPHAPGEPATAEATQALTPGASYWRNLATYFMNQNRFSEAEQALLQANAKELLPKTFWLLSEARAARGDLAGAIAALEEGFTKLPAEVTPTNLVWMVQLELKRGDKTAARALIDSRRAQLEKKPGALELAEGLIQQAEGNAEAARERFLAALRLDPLASTAAEQYLALAGDPRQRAALTEPIQRGLSIDPRIELYWRIWGILRLDAGDPERAAQSFHRAVELEPGKLEPLLGEAGAYMRAGQPRKAEAIYEQLARADIKEPRIFINLGSLRASRGEWRAAREAWERALALGADSPDLRRALDEARRHAP